MGQRHDLPMPTILDEQARVVDTGTQFDGLDRFEARKAVCEALREQGRIVKEVRPYNHSVGHSGAPVNRSNRDCRCSGGSRSSPRQALRDAVRDGETTIHPQSMEPRWFGWVDDMHDWCISRQLWWGHRIPIWYGPDGEVVCPAPGRSRRPATPRRPTCSTRGSRRACGRSRRLAGPTTPLI